MSRHAIVALSLALLMPVVAPAPAAGDPQLQATLFDPAVLHEVRLATHSADWDRLRATYLANTYYPADLTWDGHVVRNVGIRSRGTGSRDARKPALKVDFNEFVDKQEFAGLRGFALDNFRQDPAMLKETVIMQLFERMGVPGPRAVHARVYVNGEYLGLFAVIELVDKPFLASRFGDDDGYLYDFEWDFDYRFTWLGDDPRAYAAMFKAETHESEPPERLHGPLAAMIGAINRTSRNQWPAVFERYFDVGQLMAYVAVEAFLSDHDGLAGDWGVNNFYLHKAADADRFRFIPWDKDVSFREADRDVEAGMDGNALLGTAMIYPQFRAAYTAALQRCAAVAAEAVPGSGMGWLEHEIARQVALIRTAAREDVNKAFRDDRFDQEVDWMLRFARQRSGQVWRQVGRP